MEDIRGSIKLLLVFLVVAFLIVMIFLLAPESIKVPMPKEIFPN